MIIFIGTEEHGFFLKETMANEQINFTGYINLEELPTYANELTSACIVIDITQWSEKSEQIAERICNAALLTRSKIIIYAVGYSLDSILCCSLTSCGIANIITAGNLADIKAEFLNLYNSTDNTVIERTAAPINDNEIKSSSVITIAVAGAQERIGTTTQCFQIAKYLSAKGFKTAYLEFNNTDYLKMMKKLFNLPENVFSFEGINLYSAEQISRILKEYDYIIYDYGSITNPNFNKYSFSEKSICIIVCGAKPNEIDHSTAALNMFQNNDDINYLFNFVSENDMDDIKELMGAHKTYFSPLIPDIFSVLTAQQKLYDNMISVKGSPALPKKNRNRFFRRKK